jgi:hypothetical protein
VAAGIFLGANMGKAGLSVMHYAVREMETGETWVFYTENDALAMVPDLAKDADNGGLDYSTFEMTYFESEDQEEPSWEVTGDQLVPWARGGDPPLGARAEM